MGKENFFNKLFPVKYNFFLMLENQAEINNKGVHALYIWLTGRSETESDNLLQYVNEADNVRMQLEKNLIEAFSTPFDRGDIYTISVTMDRVLEYAKSTLYSMKAFEVNPNDIIIGMVEKLVDSADAFSMAVSELKIKTGKGRKVHSFDQGGTS